MSAQVKKDMKPGKILIPEIEIKEKIKNYAEKINKKYKGKKVIIVGVLTGAIFFLVELLSHLKIEFSIDFIAVSSYKKTILKKQPQFFKKTKLSLKNKHILIIEDAFDNGQTFNFICEQMKEEEYASLHFAFLLKLVRSDGPKKTYSFVDSLFLLETDQWVVGFGLDYEEKYRSLKNIHELI